METEINNMKYHCEYCNYKCIYPAHWKQHIESEKHKNQGKRKTIYYYFYYFPKKNNTIITP